MTSISARLDFHHRKREREWTGAPLFVASLEGVKTPEQILLEREQSQRLDQLIDQLKPPRAGLAVRYYYGIRCEPGTLEQVAQKFGVTRERIRQILNKALRTLRHWMLKADDRKRYLKNLDREFAERRAREAGDAANSAARSAACKLQEELELEAAREQRLARLNEQFRRQAQRDYDYCYVEAHRVNALWELELERRADEMRRKVRMAERRLQAEWAEAHRLNELWAVELARRASGYKGKRDWLLVKSN